MENTLQKIEEIKGTVWCFNKGEGMEESIYESAKQGKSRFGWGYIETADLNLLKERKDKSEDEQKCWKYTKFLLRIEPGDWIVHINTPSGGCLLYTSDAADE